MFYGVRVDKAMDVSHPSLKSSKSYRVRQGMVERRKFHCFDKNTYLKAKDLLPSFDNNLQYLILLFFMCYFFMGDLELKGFVLLDYAIRMQSSFLIQNK